MSCPSNSITPLAELLGVPWAEKGVGPFSPVYVNGGLTLDFIETTDPFPIYHFCFRVSEAESVMQGSKKPVERGKCKVNRGLR